LGIGTDEHIVLDDGLELVGAIVVAGDGAGANINALANLGVTTVGQMIGLFATQDLIMVFI